MERYPSTTAKARPTRFERVAKKSDFRQEGGASFYLMLSDVALWLALAIERKPGVRALRKAIIMRRWMRLSGDVLSIGTPPRLAL